MLSFNENLKRIDSKLFTGPFMMGKIIHNMVSVLVLVEIIGQSGFLSYSGFGRTLVKGVWAVCIKF